VPDHEGIAGNEIADLLARTGSEHPFTRPEPACSISIGVANRAVSNWLNRNHKKQWESTTGLKQAKELIPGPSEKRTRDLLKVEQRTTKMDSGTIHRTLSSKGTSLQIGTD
jgi:hypothetical protein